MPGLGERWARIGPMKRAVLVVVAAALTVNLGLIALDALLGSSPQGAPGSSLSTTEDGVAAWSELLERQGTDVEARRVPLGDARLDPSRTLVIVDPPDAPTVEGLQQVARFTASGGRLVAVGAGASGYAAVALGTDPGWADGGPLVSRPLVPSSTTTHVARVRGERRGRFLTAGGLRPLLGDGRTVTAVEAPVGDEGGVVVALADASPLRNALLGEADNAALALAVTGSRPVTFAEAEHGVGVTSGWGAVPERWRLTALALVACAGLAMWSAGQRLGPAQESARALPPPRRAYVEAMAAALSRAREDDPTAEPGGPP